MPRNRRTGSKSTASAKAQRGSARMRAAATHAPDDSATHDVRNKPRKTARDDSANVQAHAPHMDAVPSQKPKRLPPASARLPQALGMLLTTQPDKDYALVDSGAGRKLERYGDLIIDRPEGQAIWQRTLPLRRWQAADAIFTGNTDEEGVGRWHFPKAPLGETFPMTWRGIDYLGRFTSFRHTGVFPEQAAHWEFAERAIVQQLARGGTEIPRIMNLFGYTGLASLAAARAGAQVTHVDASKKAVAWARENQEVAGLADKPIRWIVDDAVKFCERELRRGNRYHGILLDPPAYGRGPKGEVWQFFEDVPHLLDITRQLIDPHQGFVVLTAYTIRASSLAIHELMQEVFGDMGGTLETGELAIATENAERLLPTSMFSRWCAGSSFR